MQSLPVYIFYGLIFILVYTYLGYGVLLWMITRLKPGRKPPENRGAYPLTLVVPAYNEADILEDKVKNCLSLDYPPGLVNFIFITDGSEDHPETVLLAYPEIQHLHQNERRGKAAAMNRAMKFVKTPFVVFSDANTFLNNDALIQLMKHFHDPSVGGVSGEKRIIKSIGEGAEQNEGIYWKYESVLKKLDAKLYSVTGAAGELFAMRTALYEDIEEDTVIEDFVLSLRICEKRYRIEYEPNATAMETASFSLQDEYKRKVRIAAGGFQAMGRLKKIWNPFFHPVLFFQFISHRILRWAVCPFLLPVIFILNLILILINGSTFITILFFLQVLFYILAGIGLMLSGTSKQVKIFSIPFYFLFMNYCILKGFFSFILGKHSPLWEKSKRKSTFLKS